jgi:hypothetical protein
MGHLSFRYANSFFDQYLNKIGKLLMPIFQKATIHKVVRKLPKKLDPDVLDANKEQLASFSQGVKVGFEQIYVMRLMTTLLTNTWHSFQLLRYGIEIESMNYTKVKQSIKRHGTHLKDSVFQLALSLIKSADERMYYVDNMNVALDLPVLSFQ